MWVEALIDVQRAVSRCPPSLTVTMTVYTVTVQGVLMFAGTGFVTHIRAIRERLAVYRVFVNTRSQDYLTQDETSDTV